LSRDALGGENAAQEIRGGPADAASEAPGVGETATQVKRFTSTRPAPGKTTTLNASTVDSAMSIWIERGYSIYRKRGSWLKIGGRNTTRLDHIAAWAIRAQKLLS